MSTAHAGAYGAPYPIDLDVAPQTAGRNRLTTALRPILAIPHLILVGGPLAFGSGLVWRWQAGGAQFEAGLGTGVLGAVAAVAALIAWFAILFTGRHPKGLRDLATLYLRWRVRAGAYVTLLRDEYPPFGDQPYPAAVHLPESDVERDRLSVALRIFLAIPHLIVLWALGVAWVVTTVVSWFAILITGTYPDELYTFGVGVFRWSIRVEAYLLLVTDAYPPFSLT